MTHPRSWLKFFRLGPFNMGVDVGWGHYQLHGVSVYHVAEFRGIQVCLWRLYFSFQIGDI